MAGTEPIAQSSTRARPCGGPRKSPRPSAQKGFVPSTTLVVACLVLSGAFAIPVIRAASVIESINPPSGTTNGGTFLNITGTGFAPGAAVQFVNGATAVTLTRIVVHSAYITAMAPPHPPGPVDIRIMNPDGSSAALAASFTYTEAAAPTITGYAPTFGPSDGGTQLVINGSGFSTNPPPRVVLRADSPASAAGTLLNLSVQSVTNNTILATMPAAASTVGSLQQVSTGTIDVFNPDGDSATSQLPFTFVPQAAPILTAITPNSGPSNGGTPAIITGQGFWPGAQVFFTSAGSPLPKAATLVGFGSPTQLVITTPPLPPSNSPAIVQVVNPDGQSTVFGLPYQAIQDVKAADGSFQVFTVSPSQGPTTGGTPVVIRGTGFASGPGLKVSFGDTEATQVRFISSTQLSAITPACSGSTTVCSNLSVINPDGSPSAVGVGLFTYIQQVAITDIAPNEVNTSGNDGNELTIHGLGFSPAGCQVLIGGLAATGMQCGANVITAIPPAGTAGPKDVLVINSDGRSAFLQAGLGYYDSPAPTITGTTPTEVTTNGNPTGGTTIIISGTGFIPVTGSGATAGTYISPVVTFTTAVGTARATVLEASGTALTVLPPPVGAWAIPNNQDSDCNFVSGHAGVPCLAASITITNVDGQNAIQPAFRASSLSGMPSLGPSENVPNFDYIGTSSAPAIKCQKSNTIPTAQPYCEASITDGGAIIDLHTSGLFAPGVLISASTTDVTSAGKGPGRVGATTFLIGNQIAAIDESIGHGITASDAWIIVPPTTTAGVRSISAINPDQSTGATGSNYLDYIKPPAPAFVLDRTSGSANGNDDSPVALIASQDVFGVGATVSFGQASVRINDLPCGAIDSGSYTIQENCVAGTSPNPNPSSETGAATPLYGTAGQEILVHPPGHAPGWVPIKVTNRDGQSYTLPNAYRYVAEVPPILTGITPDLAPNLGGTTIMINGTGFAVGSLGSSPPARIPTSTPPFQYFQTLDLSYLKPLIIIGGAVVPAEDVVVKDSGHLIVLHVPPHAVGLADISVINPDGQVASIASTFRFVGLPTAVSLAPSFGTQNGGSLIAVAGHGFDPSSPPLFFLGPNSPPSTGSAFRSSSLGLFRSPTAPKDASPDTVPVFAVDPMGETTTLPSGFTYIRPSPPSFSSLVPATGSVNGGTLVTVTGQGFSPGVQVCVGRPALDPTDSPCTAASKDSLVDVQWLDSTRIQFVTPNSLPGPADIIISNPFPDPTQTLLLPSAQSPFSFLQIPSPSMTSIHPASGNTAGGTPVTITGANFANGTRVFFGSFPAANVTVKNSNALTALSPPHVAGPVGVTVQLADGASYERLPAFTYVGVGGATTPFRAENGTHASVSGPPNGGSSAPGSGTGEDANGSQGSGPQPIPGGSVLTASQILQGNQGVSLTVHRDVNDNVLTFNLPTDLPAPVAGVQVFRSDGSWILMATLAKDSLAFLSQNYRDLGSPPDSRYLVTIYYENGQGKAAQSINEIPGFNQLGSGVSASGSNWNPMMVYAAACIVLVLLVVASAAFVLRRRRNAPPYFGDMGTAAGGRSMMECPDSNQTVNCPGCGAIFEVVGRPLECLTTIGCL